MKRVESELLRGEQCRDKYRYACRSASYYQHP